VASSPEQLVSSDVGKLDRIRGCGLSALVGIAGYMATGAVDCHCVEKTKTAQKGEAGRTWKLLFPSASARRKNLDWAIGWLAREDKIVVRPEKPSFRIRLHDADAKMADYS